MGFRSLLLAPPGAGKGTQGQILADRMGIVHLATGDLLRHHVAQGDEIGTEASSYMKAGKLVPDDVVVKMVYHRLDSFDRDAGFVLDGFPRNMDQANALYERGLRSGLMFHLVITLEVAENELISRLIERGANSGRTDDTEDTIRTRLKVYRQDTAPLLDFYQGRGILGRIDGSGTIDEVAARVWTAVQEAYDA